MISKTLTFENYAGQKETETFLFSLSKADIIELEVSNGVNGLSALMDKLAKEQENGKILAIFKSIIDMSYGVKSDDGKRFIKNPEVLEKFKSSVAYSDLIMEFFTNENAVAEFIVGLMPSDVAEAAKLRQGATAEELRSATLAAKGGFQKKQEAPKPTVQQVPELPTVAGESTEAEVKRVGASGETVITATAPAVFENDPLPVVTEPKALDSAVPAPTMDLTGVSAEQKLELFKAGRISADQL